MLSCAGCKHQACGKENPQILPENCPMRAHQRYEQWLALYHAEDIHPFCVQSTAIEGRGYGEWTRLRETIEFCKSMKYQRLGLAFCRGLRKEASVIARILCGHTFEVHSISCKNGGIPKEAVGISSEDKISPDAFEPMCNPIAQAMLLNEAETEFNILVGLCVGHDSLFMKHSNAMVTTLITKDRVLAHNPVGAVYCAEGYYKNKL